MSTESVVFDTVPRSHQIPWSAGSHYEAWYVTSGLAARHTELLEAGGVKIRTVTRPPLHACTICGTRTCAAARTGHAGCIDTEPAAAVRRQKRQLRRDVSPVLWAGTRPTRCENPGCYGVPLKEAFWDGVLPDGNGRTHGLYCEFCALTRGTPGAPVRYVKRGREYFKAPK